MGVSRCGQCGATFRLRVEREAHERKCRKGRHQKARTAPSAAVGKKKQKNGPVVKAQRAANSATAAKPSAEDVLQRKLAVAKAAADKYRSSYDASQAAGVSAAGQHREECRKLFGESRSADAENRELKRQLRIKTAEVDALKEQAMSVGSHLFALTSFAQHLLTQNLLTVGGNRRDVLHPCTTNDVCLRRFTAALTYCGIASLDDLLRLHASRVQIGFHGTSADAAAHILCRGFDPALRRAQQYGPGEYFDVALSKPLRYCQADGVIVATLILSWPGVTSVRNSTYIVANNPALSTGRSHCLPLFGFKAASQPVPCCGCRLSNAAAAYFLENGDVWTRMEPSVEAVVLAAAHRDEAGVLVYRGRYRYLVNLNKMTQHNMTTQACRPIRIV
jgi:hypothetical protein